MAATWHVQHESWPRFCTYISDRGAIFGAVPVEPSGPDDRLGALEAARTSCATPPHDVPVRGIRSLSCVEHHPSGNHAIGNTIDQETL